MSLSTVSSTAYRTSVAGRHLAYFVAYLDDISADRVTVQNALVFVLVPDLDSASRTPTRRLTAVRGFARYLAASDGRTEIPPTGLVSYRARRRALYLFTDDDLAAVVRCARAATPFRFRAETLSNADRIGGGDRHARRRSDPT